MIRIATWVLGCMTVAIALPGHAAQSGDTVQVDQTASDAGVEPQAPEGASKVYWPDEITTERVLEARRTATLQEQISRERERALLEQLTAREKAATNAGQLTDEDADEVLAQLTQKEREVLLSAVTGTDVCESEPTSAIVRRLCADRIETRSQDFASRTANRLSAEERLLGEGLSGERSNSLNRAVDRLARGGSDANDPDNQAIASIALAPPDRSDASTDEASAPSGAGELSPETQALVDAIVQQFGGGSGP